MGKKRHTKSINATNKVFSIFLGISLTDMDNMVNDSSPLHTELLKRGPRRILLSSSEEEDGVC